MRKNYGDTNRILKGEKKKKKFQKSTFFSKEKEDKQFLREFRILVIFDSRKFLRMG